MVYQEDDQERVLRDKSRKAITLAMECRWEEAAAVNREVLDMSPNDWEACNRLGKSLMEIGDTDGARHAFARSLEIAPNNTIARKNLERLATMPSAPKPTSIGVPRIAPRLFISDSGKSAQVTLFAPAPDSERPFISTGAPVRLERRDGDLAVRTESGEYLGMVPPKLGRRLACLIDGGNQYEGVMFSSTPDAVKVLLRETYQHPSQRSKISFPSMDQGPEPEQTKVIEDDIEGEFDVESLERPVDLSWVDDEDEEPHSAAGASVGSVLDEGLMDDALYPDSIDDE